MSAVHICLAGTTYVSGRNDLRPKTHRSPFWYRRYRCLAKRPCPRQSLASDWEAKPRVVWYGVKATCFSTEAYSCSYVFTKFPIRGLANVPQVLFTLLMFLFLVFLSGFAQFDVGHIFWRRSSLALGSKILEEPCVGCRRQ